MPYAIFSDVHSNFEALKSFFDQTDPEENLVRVCLGDLVGYAACPNECVGMIREREIPVVIGNHDLAVLDLIEKESFNELARVAIEWHVETLSDDHKRYLSTLPFTQTIDDHFAITHADFSSPVEFPYVVDKRDASLSFSGLETQIGFFGHTHVPAICTEDESRPMDDWVTFELIYGDNQEVVLHPEKRYLINPGSIGQPRDGDPRAAYVIFEPEEMSVTYRRLSYDCEKEAERIRETAALPPLMADRLLHGF